MQTASVQRSKPTLDDFVMAIKKGGIENAFDYIFEYQEKDNHHKFFQKVIEKIEKETGNSEVLQSKYLKMEQNYIQTKSHLKNITKLLEDKQKYITDLENTMNEMSKNMLNTDRFGSQEVVFHTQKQLLRDYNELSERFEKLQFDLKKKSEELEEHKIRERSYAKILFKLSKKGVPIEKMLEKETKEKTDRQSSTITESSSEFDSSMFLPIVMDSPKRTIKPSVIPELDLKEITAVLNTEPSKQKVNEYKRNKLKF